MNKIAPKLLSCRYLPHADPRLCAALGLKRTDHQALALVTCDQDDTLYAALDHATKMAPVEVVYARSFFAGAAHASGPLSGEVMGVLAGADPDIVQHGVSALKMALAELFAFYSINGSNLFPTVIPSVGEYLAGLGGVAVGSPFGYFIAPPLEAMLGVDAALKAADVRLLKFFGPPTETNFAGCYVTGTLASVQAASVAFVGAIEDVVARPLL